MKDMKKRVLCFLAAAVLIFAGAFPVYAVQATNGAEISVEIPTWNNDTAFICQLGEGILYIEVESAGAVWPLDTANPFAATVVTVVDAQGAELGTLESVNGTIDYYEYPEAAKLICSTAFTHDIYEVDLAQFAGTGVSQPEFIPEGLGEGRKPSTAEVLMGGARIITYVVMALWVVIWIVVISWLIRNRKRKREKENSPLYGKWELEITTPHGVNNAVLQLLSNGGELKGVLNDSLNKDVPLRQGVMTPDGFEGLMNIDIGMNGTPEFKIEGFCDGPDRMHGQLTLTQMTTIQSSFTGKKEA